MEIVAGHPEKHERNRAIFEEYVSGSRKAMLAAKYGLSLNRVWQIIERFRDELPTETVDEARKVDLERLDALLEPYFAEAMRGDHRSALVVLKILERRGHIFGYDKPLKVEMSDGTVTLTEAQQQFLRQVESNGSTRKQITAN